LLRVGRNQFLLLADFSIDRDLDIANYALAVLGLHADDLEAVPGKFGVFAFHGMFGLVGGAIVSWILGDVHVDRRHAQVSLNLGMRSGNLDSLFGARDRVDGRAQNIALGIVVDVARALLQFDQIGLPAVGVEEHRSAVFGQAKAGGDLRSLRLF